VVTQVVTIFSESHSNGIVFVPALRVCVI